MHSIIKMILTSALLVLSVIPAVSQDGIYGSGGGRLIFSEDEQVSQHYYKPFARLGWSGDMADLSVSYYRWISYTVTDALFNKKEIDINQPEADITIYAGDILSMSGGYSYMSGSSSYTAHRYTGEIVLDFGGINISADGSLKNVQYDFNGTIKNSYITAGGEASFDITANFSWDAGYFYEFTDYKSYGYTYKKNTGRTGFALSAMKSLYFLAGISGARDSDGINSAGFDAGITVKFFDHLKFSAAYMLNAEFISSDATESSGRRRASSTTETSETDISHTGSLAVSFYF